MTSSLTAVNIASNQFNGNLSEFAQPLEALTTVYASNNCLADVTPAISDKVTTLTLQNQTIDKVVTIDVNNSDVADVWSQIPTILLYDHASQGYAEKIRLACTDVDSDWSITLDCQSGSITPLSPDDFDGPNDKVLTVQVVDDNDQPTGSSLKVKFLYEPTSIRSMKEQIFSKPTDVYNLYGAKVATKVTSLDELPAGTYIIGGRKVNVAK